MLDGRRFVLIGRSFSGRTTLVRAVAGHLGARFDLQSSRVDYPDGWSDICRRVCLTGHGAAIVFEWAASSVVRHAGFCRARLAGASVIMMLPIHAPEETDDFVVQTDRREVELMLQAVRDAGADPFGCVVRWIATRCDRGGSFNLPDDFPLTGTPILHTSGRTGEGVADLVSSLQELQRVPSA
jgi:hypothetical protein